MAEGTQVRIVGQQRSEGRDRPQHAHVTEPAVTLLEVGLEQERHITRYAVALGHLRFEVRQVARAERIAPGVAGVDDQGVGDLVVPPDQAGIEQAECNPDVIGCGGEDLARPPHRMVQPNPFVPDRVPDGVGDGLYVATAGMEEHDIEVAEGAERASPVPSDGKKCQVTVIFSQSPVRHGGEPFVGLRRVRPAEFVTLELGPGQEGATSFPERRVSGHGGNVALGS